MRIGNVERNQHTKFHRPSSILNMKKIGGTKPTEEEEEEEEEDTFLAPNRPISESCKI